MIEDFWKILEERVHCGLQRKDARQLLSLLPKEFFRLGDSRFFPTGMEENEVFQNLRKRLKELSEGDPDEPCVLMLKHYECVLLAEALTDNGKRGSKKWADFLIYDVMYFVGKCWSRLFFGFSDCMTKESAQQHLDQMQEWIGRAMKERALRIKWRKGEEE